MKVSFLSILFFAMSVHCYSQNKKFTVHQLRLPSELSYYDNQFSGLQVVNQKLYLMSESRLEDKREPKLYSINLTDIDHKLQDSNYVLPFEKVTMTGLEDLAVKMKENGQEYEGLEAFLINKEMIYFSVETNTPSSYCYLLKGVLKGNHINLSPELLPVMKPRLADGSAVYNAGFEAITFIKKRIYAFFEYNYFDRNYVYSFNNTLKESSEDSVSIDPLPFRITDITPAGKNHFTAINYFYKGGGGDTIYRVPSEDIISHSLIYSGNSYKSYSRLIDLKYSGGHFTWKPLWVFPDQYTGFNWEGIAAYKKGYFIMNDKYTVGRPNESVLLFVTE